VYARFPVIPVIPGAREIEYCVAESESGVNRLVSMSPSQNCQNSETRQIPFTAPR